MENAIIISIIENSTIYNDCYNSENYNNMVYRNSNMFTILIILFLILP